jgi:hypothetical protein
VNEHVPEAQKQPSPPWQLSPAPPVGAGQPVSQTLLTQDRRFVVEPSLHEQ